MNAREDAPVLYSKEEADGLTRSERAEDWRIATDKLKADLIIDNLDGAKSLLDIGCAWGQILRQLVGKVPVLAGVDESQDRLGSLAGNDLGIKTYLNTASSMDIEDRSFDIVLTSHVMHELKLFGTKEELARVLKEIKRVIKDGGRYFIIDHLDPGEGKVVIGLNDKTKILLEKFIARYRYRKAHAAIKGMEAELSRRDCHDFITKIWSIDGGAEGLEMEETHTIMKEDELKDDLTASGFEIIKWVAFNPIKILMDHYNIEFIKGDPWDRQFMLIARKP